MKIASYNVNGIRAALGKGLLDWLKEENFDIIGFQETKAQLTDIPVAEFEKLGYYAYFFSAEKKGYSGVGLLSKVQPKDIVYGQANPRYDSEGRTIRLDFETYSVLNTYFPSGSSGDARQDFKMEFLDAYFDFIQNLKKSHPNLIVMGDYNICHQEIDIHDPKGNKNNSGFLPEERAWMSKWFDEGGMVDSFRALYPDQRDIYSWWTYRFGARGKNKGWRIDYISHAQTLHDKLLDAKIHDQIVHSDHCPISATYAL
ncbi:MAG: exodeoxyribonuclease III [Chitinophagales bacterium]|jgi:exodeoxyribonuclease-3|nr:exodeoxyribonuclease III [Chitinophagales bacterium]